MIRLAMYLRFQLNTSRDLPRLSVGGGRGGAMNVRDKDPTESDKKWVIDDIAGQLATSSGSDLALLQSVLVVLP